jgi:hypothetical protein
MPVLGAVMSTVGPFHDILAVIQKVETRCQVTLSLSTDDIGKPVDSIKTEKAQFSSFGFGPVR